MSNQIHVMIDIETLAVTEDATILSIGAASFNKLGIDKTFYIELDITSQNRKIGPDTLKWWISQGNIPSKGVVQLAEGLLGLTTFLCGFFLTPEEGCVKDNITIWAKGSDFDPKILAHAYTQLGQSIPWKYNAVRDCRTVFKLCDFKPRVNPKPHNALSDAINQAEHLINCLYELKVKDWYVPSNVS